jgi:hypothetical protein
MTLCGRNQEIKMLKSEEYLSISDRDALKEMLTVTESAVCQWYALRVWDNRASIPTPRQECGTGCFPAHKRTITLP